MSFPMSFECFLQELTRMVATVTPLVPQTVRTTFVTMTMEHVMGVNLDGRGCLAL